jgi:glycosyltransferase involved in cell wall biosynthesis
MTKRMLFSHPTGNANVRAALAGLQAANGLGEFHTTIAAFPGNLWDRLSRTPVGRELKRRTFETALQPLTVQHPIRELGRMLSARLKLGALSKHEQGVFCIDAIYRTQDAAVARQLRRHPTEFSGVYTYEDGALETLRAAKELNLRRVYDLPIAFWSTLRRLLAEEVERMPQWQPTLGGGVQDSAAKLERKSQEIELADTVICPSEFVARSLPPQLSAKIVVAPFGSPAAPLGEKPAARNGKLRVLFAGSMSQRKGLGDLMAAMRQLKRNDVELVVMGSPQAPMQFYRQEFSGFVHEPVRPHAEVLQLMQQCDVFCLPSIVEGRALVMQEAMSQGLPLLITPNTGGEDLIEEGVTGFLVPIRQPQQLAEKISWFADHREDLPEMSRAARSRAAALTWAAYGRTVAQASLN